MQHFHRTSLGPDDVLATADAFFPTLGLAAGAREKRRRTFAGPIGEVVVTVQMEGGHYTLVTAATDQMGESRLDRGVKRFFTRVHRAADPSHATEVAY